jgi:predicted ester cyclase
VKEFNRGNLDILDEACSPSFVFHTPSNPDWEREQMKSALAMMHRALPDWQITLDDIFSTEDKAAYRITCQDTHLGELWGVSPTVKQMIWTAMIVGHYKNEKLVEESEFVDHAGLRRQLGLVAEAQSVRS